MNSFDVSSFQREEKRRQLALEQQQANWDIAELEQKLRGAPMQALQVDQRLRDLEKAEFHLDLSQQMDAKPRPFELPRPIENLIPDGKRWGPPPLPPLRCDLDL